MKNANPSRFERFIGSATDVLDALKRRGVRTEGFQGLNIAGAWKVREERTHTVEISELNEQGQQVTNARLSDTITRNRSGRFGNNGLDNEV